MGVVERDAIGEEKNIEKWRGTAWHCHRIFKKYIQTKLNWGSENRRLVGKKPIHTQTIEGFWSLDSKYNHEIID